MGQRTQSVFEVVKTFEDYSTGKKSKKTYVGSYHNQWGFAKMQLFDVMRFITTYQEGCSKDDYNMPERLYKAYRLDGNEYERPFKGKATPKRVMDWMNKTQDNNNGGLLLKLNVDHFNYIQSGELYIFNDPEKDYDEYYDKHPDGDSNKVFDINRCISFFEYMSLYPQYFNEPFVTAFTALMRFYNIEIKEPEREGEC